MERYCTVLRYCTVRPSEACSSAEGLQLSWGGPRGVTGVEKIPCLLFNYVPYTILYGFQLFFGIFFFAPHCPPPVPPLPPAPRLRLARPSGEALLHYTLLYYGLGR